MLPIRTPSPDPLELAALYTIGVSASSVTAQFSVKYLNSTKIGYFQAYSMLLAGIGMWGLVRLASPIHLLLGTAALTALGASAGGLIGAFLARWETFYSDHFSRRTQPERGRGLPTGDVLAHIGRALTASQLHSGRRRRTLASSDMSQRLRIPSIQTVGLVQLLIIALLEEVQFRYVLVSWSFTLETPALVATTIVLSTALFCLNHIWYGSNQVILKAPLGFGTVLIVLTTRSLLPAIFMHAVYNLQLRRRIVAGQLSGSVRIASP